METEIPWYIECHKCGEYNLNSRIAGQRCSECETELRPPKPRVIERTELKEKARKIKPKGEQPSLF